MVLKLYISTKVKRKMFNFIIEKFLDAGIQDVSMSISIVHSLIERSPDGDGDESDKHI